MNEVSKKTSKSALHLICVTIALSILVVSNLTAEIRVGVIAGFTGDWSGYGEAYRRGIEIANIDPEVKFIYEDDQFIPTKSISAFRKLVESDGVSAVIVGDTATALALAPIAKQRKVPLLVYANADVAFSNNPYILRLWVNDNQEFGLLKESISKKGFKRIAIFTSIHPYSDAWGKSIKNNFPDSHWEAFSIDPQSFQLYIAKLKKSNFDAVAICLYPGNNGRFVKQMQNMNFKSTTLSCNLLESGIDIQTGGKAIDDVPFISAKLSNIFIESYISVFKKPDYIFSVALLHDAAKILEAAAQDQSKASLMDKILSAKPTQTAIENLAIKKDLNDNYLSFSLAEFVFKNGQVIQKVD